MLWVLKLCSSSHAHNQLHLYAYLLCLAKVTNAPRLPCYVLSMRCVKWYLRVIVVWYTYILPEVSEQRLQALRKRAPAIRSKDVTYRVCRYWSVISSHFRSVLPFDNTTIRAWNMCKAAYDWIIITHVHVILVANKSMFLSWLYRTIKECLSVTENLKSVTFQGIPLRERDLTCLAKVWWNILLVIY